MSPLIRPGSIVQIDQNQRRILNVKWENEYDRPIYFLELRGSYLCSWCEVGGGYLSAIPHPNSKCEVRRFAYPREADIVGRVVCVTMRLATSVRTPAYLGETCVLTYACRSFSGFRIIFGKKGNYGDQRPVTAVARRQEIVPGRHRETNGTCFAAISPASKMATPFPPLRRSRNWRGRSRFLCTSCSTMASRRNFRICSREKARTKLPGGSSGKNGIYLHKLVKCLRKATDSDRKLLLSMAQKLAGGRSRPAAGMKRKRATLLARFADCSTVLSYFRFAGFSVFAGVFPVSSNWRLGLVFDS